MFGDFESLMHARQGRRMRSSSWDRSGANRDHVSIDAGGTHDLFAVGGAGVIRHIWITVNAESPTYLRELVLRMHWDGASRPSVEAPLGDFFGLGHARAASFTSAPLSVVTGGKPEHMNFAAFNCWFAMPFEEGARISLVNEGLSSVSHLYYYVDFDERVELDPRTLRFHAHYRQERPTQGELDLSSLGWDDVARQPNLDASGNYVILDVAGRGHYVGCVLSVDHLNPIATGGWFGEGDDMIFIDGRPGLGAPPRPESGPGANDAWPPTLHGTGTEDYFGAAWGYPANRHASLYHGVTIAGIPEGGPMDYAGKWTMYRFHLPDPVMFERAVRVTIEHGHANCHSDDYSSVAFWYQEPLAQELPPMPEVAARSPRSDLESYASYFRTKTG